MILYSSKSALNFSFWKVGLALCLLLGVSGFMFSHSWTINSSDAISLSMLMMAGTLTAVTIFSWRIQSKNLYVKNRRQFIIKSSLIQFFLLATLIVFSPADSMIPFINQSITRASLMLLLVWQTVGFASFAVPWSFKSDRLNQFAHFIFLLLFLLPICIYMLLGPAIKLQPILLAM